MTRKQLPKAIKPATLGARPMHAEPEVEAPIPATTSPVQLQARSEEVWPPSPPPANDALPVAISVDQSQAEMRLRAALRVVERHKLYAGLGGLVPMPAVSVVGVTAINLRMVKALSELYGVPFERDKMRSLIIGLMGGAAPSGLAVATSSTLAFIPVAGAFGLAVSTVAASALTRRIGLYFLERLERDALA